MPYHYSDDFRIKWLEEEFLPWLNKWETQINSRIDVKTKEKSKLMLSTETLFGIRITALSFIDLFKEIFQSSKVKSFLSEHICQDPLEKFFGRQRQIGSSN
jgi:hypothetical protein